MHVIEPQLLHKVVHKKTEEQRKYWTFHADGEVADPWGALTAFES
jgi:hypothetical protein